MEKALWIQPGYSRQNCDVERCCRNCCWGPAGVIRFCKRVCSRKPRRSVFSFSVNCGNKSLGKYHGCRGAIEAGSYGAKRTGGDEYSERTDAWSAPGVEWIWAAAEPFEGTCHGTTAPGVAVAGLCRRRCDVDRLRESFESVAGAECGATKRDGHSSCIGSRAAAVDSTDVDGEHRAVGSWGSGWR